MNQSQKEFLKGCHNCVNYWSGVNTQNCDDKTKKLIKDNVEGAIFSLLVMLDGDSAINDFHSYQITNEITGENINCGNLHDLFYQIKKKSK